MESTTKKYPVITLCGSTKFKDQFLAAQKHLTLSGNIILSVGFFSQSGDTEPLTEDTAEMLAAMHRQKIDMADEIFVIDMDGYIGPSTQSEIAYATQTGKPIRYWSQEPLGQ